MKLRSLKILLFAICLSGATRSNLKAQSSLTIDASQVMSNFQFTDSTGQKNDTSYSVNYSGAYSLGYRYSTESGLIVSTSIGMRKGGATLVIDNSNYVWDLQYANFKLGAGYVYGEGRFKPYLMVSGYFALLLKANQRLNNENFDIIESGHIQKIDYGLHITPGVQFKISDDLTVYTEIGYLQGLSNIETSTSGQNSKNTAYTLTLGMSFTIK